MHSHHSPNTNHEHFHERFQSVKEYAQQLDSPERESWQKPEEIISFMNIPEHASIADIGAGTGYFSFRIVESYPDASVTAIDIDPDMVAYIRAKAKKLNIESITGRVSDDPANFTQLHSRFDRILIVNTIHHIPHRTDYFSVLQNTLNDNGEIIVIDFTLESDMGPPAEHRVGATMVEKELRKSGLVLTEHSDLLLPNQYCLRFSKK